jgi:predicted PurR-regulated permease PerM
MAKRIRLDSATKFFISVIGLTIIAIVLKELSHIFIPFVIAYFLFFLFSPLNTFLTKSKFPLFSVVIIDLLILAFILWGVSSFIIGAFVKFGQQIPEYFNKLDHIVSSTAVSLSIRDPFFRYFSIERIISKINYQQLAGGIFNSTFALIGNALFILFFFIFVMTGHNTIYEAIKDRFVFKRVKPEMKKVKKKYMTSAEKLQTELTTSLKDTLSIERQTKEEKLANTFRTITEQIQRYIILKILINLTAGVIVAVFLAILGVDFPIIWGLFVFIFNFIPTIGSAISLVLPVTMALLEYESFTFALIVALILIAIQTLFFNILETSFVGKRLNLNPLLILLAVLIWGYIWGIVGMLLAVPLTAIIKIIISNSNSRNLNFLADLMSKG